MNGQTAPDLLNGYMVNGYGNPNLWQTGIECVLRRRDSQGQTQTAYLSQECRAEAVGPRIFFGGLYEFVVIEGWTGTLFLRHGAAVYSLNPFANRDARKRFCVEHSDIRSRVHCQEAAIAPQDVAKTIDYLRDETPSKGNRLFMRLAWSSHGFDYELFAPCRYTNFPHPDNPKRYLQPISGYVLFDDRGALYLAYGACFVPEDGAPSLEFFVRDQVSYLSLKVRPGLLGKILRWLGTSIFGRLLMTDEFARIERQPEAICDFYTYVGA